jgi:hypothetical protein
MIIVVFIFWIIKKLIGADRRLPKTKIVTRLEKSSSDNSTEADEGNEETQKKDKLFFFYLSDGNEFFRIRRNTPGRWLRTPYTVVNDRIRCRIRPYTCHIRSVYDRISPYYMWQYYDRIWPWSYTLKYGEIRRPYFSRIRSFTTVFWKNMVHWPPFFCRFIPPRPLPPSHLSLKISWSKIKNKKIVLTVRRIVGSKWSEIKNTLSHLSRHYIQNFKIFIFI